MINKVMQSLSSCQPSPHEFFNYSLYVSTLAHAPCYSEIRCLSEPNHEEIVLIQKPTLGYQTHLQLNILHLDAPEPNSTNLGLLYAQIQEPVPNHLKQTERPNLPSIQISSLPYLGSKHKLATKPFNNDIIKSFMHIPSL